MLDRMVEKAREQEVFSREDTPKVPNQALLASVSPLQHH
jgi:hypothetical protein